MSNSAQPAPAAPVLLEARHEGIATLVMNRADRLNALNTKLIMALSSAFTRISKDESVRVVVLTGAGRAFCAGGDLAQIAEGRASSDSKELELLLATGMEVVIAMRIMPQPVIAAVNGAAAGAGMNLALAADIRIAAEEAMFGQNFAKVGLFPDFGAQVGYAVTARCAANQPGTQPASRYDFWKRLLEIPAPLCLAMTRFYLVPRNSETEDGGQHAY